MSSSLRRGTLAATVLALSVASLSACSAGSNAPTEQDPARQRDGAHQARQDPGRAGHHDRRVRAGRRRSPGASSTTPTGPRQLTSITLGGSNGAVALHPGEGQEPEGAGARLARAGRQAPRLRGDRRPEGRRHQQRRGPEGRLPPQQDRRGLAARARRARRARPAPVRPEPRTRGRRPDVVRVALGRAVRQARREAEQEPTAVPRCGQRPGHQHVTPTANPGSGVGTPQS